MHAAHMELNSLKAHARDQEAVIADMQEELRNNQSVLGAISKCARKRRRLIRCSKSSSSTAPSFACFHTIMN